jgi:hypothetical protein
MKSTNCSIDFKTDSKRLRQAGIAMLYPSNTIRGAAVRSYIAVASLFVGGCLGLTAPATAEGFKEQVVGTWLLVSGTERTTDGKDHAVWVDGRLILDNTRHIAFFLIGKDQPKDNPDPWTPAGLFINYQGLYTLDDTAKALLFIPDIVSSSSPDRVLRKQTISFNGDNMAWTASPVKIPEGEFIPFSEWTRAK